MKKIQLLVLGFALSTGFAFADDVDIAVVNTTPGMDDGSIELNISGGIAPYQFNWVGPDGFESSEEDLVDLSVGTYTVTVTDLYCGYATMTVVVEEGVVDEASIGDGEERFNLSIYPNPTHGQLHLVSELPIDVIVYNILGSPVLNQKNVTEIDLSDFPSGSYLVQVASERGTITRKISKL